MKNFRSSFSKIYTIIIILLFLLNFNNVWANNFISRGYYVIDLSQKLEWMTCTVGMVWDKDKCVGKPIKVKLDQIDSVIYQANEQLEGSWRLPNRKELERIVCRDCQKVKINFDFLTFLIFWLLIVSHCNLIVKARKSKTSKSQKVKIIF